MNAQSLNILKSIFDQFSSKQHVMRLLEKTDYNKNYFSTLANLTSAPQLSQQEFEDEFNFEQQLKLFNYVHIVIQEVDTKMIVAAGSVIVEKSIIGNVGHIEGIVVAKGQEGKGWGNKIMKALNRIGLEVQNCLKCSLYCKSSNVVFYEKLGYVKEGDECFQRK